MFTSRPNTNEQKAKLALLDEQPHLMTITDELQPWSEQWQEPQITISSPQRFLKNKSLPKLNFQKFTAQAPNHNKSFLSLKKETYFENFFDKQIYSKAKQKIYQRPFLNLSKNQKEGLFIDLQCKDSFRLKKKRIDQRKILRTSKRTLEKIEKIQTEMENSREGKYRCITNRQSCDFLDYSANQTDLPQISVKSIQFDSMNYHKQENVKKHKFSFNLLKKQEKKKMNLLKTINNLKTQQIIGMKLDLLSLKKIDSKTKFF